jgi:hypothetical protein
MLLMLQVSGLFSRTISFSRWTGIIPDNRPGLPEANRW